MSWGEYKKYGIIRCGILYNNLKYHPIFTVQGSVYSNKFKKREEGRIYIATLFEIINTDNIILIINGHFPHDTINNIAPFKYIQDEIKNSFNNIGIKINKSTPFIFVGDFNRDLSKLKPVYDFTFLDQSLLFNTNIKTCCTTDNVDRIKKVEYETDHIIFSKKFFIRPIYNTIDLYPASDHFALNATIELKGSSLTKNSSPSSLLSKTKNETEKVIGGKKI